MRRNHDVNFSGFTRTVLSAAVALVCASPVWAQTAADDGQPRAKDDNVRLGTIVIVGEGGAQWLWPPLASRRGDP